MDAGKVITRYRDQMESLAELKNDYPNTLYPFIFADPRRMVAPADKEKNYRGGDKIYFSYTHEQGSVTLGDCFIRDYLEGYKFSGIKIYPALGYYPFDEQLLPLWKYAADNGIPVITHCIRGTIFFRGKKQKDWNRHPVFEQAEGKGGYDSLLLPQMGNVDFSINFTHPLNYLCLLEEILLRKWVGKCNGETKLLFGFTNEETPLKSNLRHLKICFGHFGAPSPRFALAFSPGP